MQKLLKRVENWHKKTNFHLYLTLEKVKNNAELFIAIMSQVQLLKRDFYHEATVTKPSTALDI